MYLILYIYPGRGDHLLPYFTIQFNGVERDCMTPIHNFTDAKEQICGKNTWHCCVHFTSLFLSISNLQYNGYLVCEMETNRDKAHWHVDI
jgi:hypothetical protein